MARSRWDGAGGISGLVELIERHGEAIDADLQHFYPGRSLADLVTGRMSFRQLGVLIKGLPGDGTAIWRANRRTQHEGPVVAVDPPDDWWTPDRQLMATAIDELRLLFWTKTKDAARGENMPQPIKRPGVSSNDVHRGTPMTIADFEDFWSRATGGGGEPVDPHGEPDAPEDSEGDAPSGEG